MELSISLKVHSLLSLSIVPVMKSVGVAAVAAAAVLNAALVAVLLSVAGVAAQEQIDAVSFRPPYSSFDAEGQRMIPNWQSGGSVDINENFVRLTPDRAVCVVRQLRVTVCLCTCVASLTDYVAGDCAWMLAFLVSCLRPPTTSNR